MLVHQIIRRSMPLSANVPMRHNVRTHVRLHLVLLHTGHIDQTLGDGTSGSKHQNIRGQ